MCLIMGSLFLMLNTKSKSTQGELVFGFGTMLTWISLINYYQNVKGFNIITNTIENSSVIIFKAIAGIMPVFIGYGLIGTCIFWRSHRFNTMSTSLFSLFSVMNGDMIFDCWHDIDTVDFLLAQLYLYTFIGFSICVVLNTFIVIIEDGYVMQKYFARTDWVKGVNQGTSLHMIEHLAKEGGGAGQHAHGDTPNTANLEDSVGNFSDAVKTAEGASPSKPNIPMLHGMPLPHEGDPFVRLLKRKSKDIRSRVALIKMLRYDKLDIIQKEHRAKHADHSVDTSNDLPHFGRDIDDSQENLVLELRNTPAFAKGTGGPSTGYVRDQDEEHKETGKQMF
uniref:Polycystin cation channel PKD1/PKD2 domain-containing protein n=1 Tax=Euplotes harpa TaxID=151035 RepID=A0A7S3NE95_9SPIT